MRKLALSAALILTAAIFAMSAPGKASAESFKVAFSTWVGYGPLYVAQDKGYFKDEGVDVELVKMEDPKLRFTALLAGRIDMLATTVDTMVLYLKTPDAINFICPLDDSNGGDGIVANKDIKTIADLKGKKVAFNEGSVSHFYLTVLMDEAGISQKDIEAVNMTAGDSGSAFVSKNVDAAVTWEPWLSRGKATDHGHLLADSSTRPGLITDILVATKEAIAKDSDKIGGVVRAWARAVDFWKANPEEANVIMAKGVGGWLKDPKVFADVLTGIKYYDTQMIRDFFGTPAKPGQLYKTTKQSLDIWGRHGKVQVETTPDKIINHSFLP